jgi:dual specificity tyrosine-phosphorylation-regulated kinase 2/3/4
MPYLAPYERTEILEFPQVYFVGPQSKKNQGNAEQVACNFGYDDERGDYKIIKQDHLAYRYEILEVMGKGSFGQVVKCFDHRTGHILAIKIIRNKKRFHAQALVEVKILEKLMKWVS